MPSEWQEKVLGDLITLEYGAGLPESSRSGSGFPVYGSSGIVGQHSNYFVNGSGIVVGRKGTVGAVAWSEGPFWPIDTTYYVLKKGKTETRWCYWLLQTIGLDRLDSSTGVPGLNRNDAYSIRVKAPPLPEQRRIAEILDTIDEAIQKTEALISKLKAMKQGLLHDLLTRGLDESGKLRDPKAHPEQFKDSPLGRIPKEWRVVSIEAIGADKPHAIVDGPFGSNLKSIHYRKKGVPVIQSGFVTTGEFIAHEYVYVNNALFQAQRRSAVVPGDIVMAKIGAQCGTCAILPEGHPVGILAGNSLKISTNPNYCRTLFLLRVLHRYYQIGLMDKVITETAQPAISLKNLRAMLIPLSSLMEQDSIVSNLNFHDSRIRTEEQYRDKLKLQKKGLMHDLLTGKVRVEI